MKKRNRYRWSLVVSMVFLALGSSAQGVFTWRAPLDSIVSDGFYQIRLTPEIVAKCRADFADVRILGPDGRFVSYVLKDPFGSDSAGRARLPIPDAVILQKDSSDKRR